MQQDLYQKIGKELYGSAKSKILGDAERSMLESFLDRFYVIDESTYRNKKTNEIITVPECTIYPTNKEYTQNNFVSYT